MSEVHASLLLATVHAAALTVAPGPGDACPTSAQVLSAIETRASGLVAPRLDDDPAKLLTLTLMPASPSGETSFSLMDRAGLVKLYRSLPAPTGDRARDCAALADTVAFIVLRYFEEVELPALPERKPPSPPPERKPAPPPERKAPPEPSEPKVEATEEPAAPLDPAKLALSAVGGRRFPGTAKEFGGFEGKLTAGVMLKDFASHQGDLWLDVAVGFAGHGTLPVEGRPTDSVTTNRVTGELALLAGWRLGQSRIYAGPATNLDLMWVESNLGGTTQREQRFAAAAGMKIGYQHFWRRVFVRSDLTGDVALVKEEVAVVSTKGHQTVVISAPRMYVTLALGLGVWF
jgi:hypothetical protein